MDRTAQEEADRKAKEAQQEADRKAKEEVDRKAQEEADRKAKEEADRKAKEEADRKAKDEADRKAKEEADRKAQQEADRKAKEEADRKAKEEVDRKTKEAQQEADRKAKEEADRKAKEAQQEADRKAKEEAERKAKVESQRTLGEHVSSTTGPLHVKINCHGVGVLERLRDSLLRQLPESPEDFLLYQLRHTLKTTSASAAPHALLNATSSKFISWAEKVLEQSQPADAEVFMRDLLNKRVEGTDTKNDQKAPSSLQQPPPPPRPVPAQPRAHLSQLQEVEAAAATTSPAVTSVPLLKKKRQVVSIDEATPQGHLLNHLAGQLLLHQPSSPDQFIIEAIEKSQKHRLLVSGPQLQRAIAVQTDRFHTDITNKGLELAVDGRSPRDLLKPPAGTGEGRIGIVPSPRRSARTAGSPKPTAEQSILAKYESAADPNRHEALHVAAAEFRRAVEYSSQSIAAELAVPTNDSPPTHHAYSQPQQITRGGSSTPRPATSTVNAYSVEAEETLRGTGASGYDALIRREAHEKDRLERELAILRIQQEQRDRAAFAEVSQQRQIAAVLQAEEMARFEADAQRKRIVQLTQRSAELDAQLQRKGLLHSGERSQIPPPDASTVDGDLLRQKLRLIDLQKQRELLKVPVPFRSMPAGGPVRAAPPTPHETSPPHSSANMYDETMHWSGSRAQVPSYFTPVRPDTFAPVPVGAHGWSSGQRQQPLGLSGNKDWEQFSPARYLR